MSQHFLPVDEYAHHKIKFRFTRYFENSKSYKIEFSIDGGNTWRVVERYKDLWDGEKDPDDEWGEELVFADDINTKLDYWKKKLVTYEDLYYEFLAHSVRLYEAAMAKYKNYTEKTNQLPNIINGF